MYLKNNILFSPIEHFEISYLISCQNKILAYVSLDSLIVYSSLIFFVILLVYTQLRGASVIKKNKLFIFFEFIFYFLLKDMLKMQVSSSRALKFFPILMSFFFFLIILNISSLFSNTISVTGHLIVTFSIAFIIFFALIIIGFLNNKGKFLKYFVPSGVPVFLKVFLIIIEILSFLIRPFSLSIRLFANMLAGHTLMNIFGSFTFFVAKKFSIFFVVPIFLCLLIVLLEFGVAIIQAYVFIILITIYINDIMSVYSH